MLVETSLGSVSFGNWRLVELGLLLTEEASLVELQGEVFLEEVWLRITVAGAGQAEVPQKREMVGGGPVGALQKRGKVGGGLVGALRKKETEACPVGAQRLGEKVASQVGACQVVVRRSVKQGASLGGAMMEVILEGALLVEVEASGNTGQTEVALTCSPYTGSSHSEMN